jgi:hypothetical protein
LRVSACAISTSNQEKGSLAARHNSGTSEVMIPSKVISITRGQPAVRKLNIRDEKMLRDLFLQMLYEVDVLRERLGPLIADEIERRKSELTKAFRARSGVKSRRLGILDAPSGQQC